VITQKIPDVHFLQMKYSFAFFLIFFSNVVVAQCTEEVLPMDFSGGKCRTRRMTFMYTNDFSEFSKKWNENADTWIKLKDYKRSELQTNKDYQLHYFQPKHSLDSNIFFFVHGIKIQKGLALGELTIQNLDTLVYLIQGTLAETQSSYFKKRFANVLRYSEKPIAKEILVLLATDTCRYVRLEAALSLAILGETLCSISTFLKLWNLNDQSINLDEFEYFTEGMRDIATSQSTDFLIALSNHQNPFCRLDASICLLQQGKESDCLKGLETVLSSDSKDLFLNAALVIKRFYPRSILEKELTPYQSQDNIPGYFSKYLLSN